MDSISLKELEPDEQRRLEEAFKTNTKDKIIIYVEDRVDVGGPTSQLLKFKADRSAELHWAKTGDEALDLVKRLCDEDPHAAHRMILITDDDLGGLSMIDGQSLIHRIHNAQNEEMKNMPVLLFTGFTMPQAGVESDVVNFMDEHTAVTAKPFNVYVISRAIEVLEEHRDVVESGPIQSAAEKKEAMYRGKSDDELEKIVHDGESFYHTLKAMKEHRDTYGVHLARSDKTYWEHDQPPRRSEDRIWADQRDDTLEAIGYARSELERRAKAKGRDFNPD